MKFTEVNPFNKKIQNKINKSVIKTIQKKDFILGENVKKFEIKFSKLSNSKYAIGCATGTDALLLALKSLNLKKNHEVIIPGMSYISTGLCVALNNNKIIFADIDDDTGLISIDSVKKKLSKNTKVIIPVNLYGQKVNLKQLRKIVGKNVSIIEDSAQSHFSYSCYDCGNGMNEICCKKERNHTYADISCYSFYPSKNLGAYGDGGIVTTNNRSLYNKINILRNLGAVKKNLHDYEGLNSRLDTIQASILINKLKNLSRNNNKRKEIAKFYNNNIKNKFVKLIKYSEGCVYHQFVILCHKEKKLINLFNKEKIQWGKHYPKPLHKLEATRKIFVNQTFPNAEKFSKQGISLPIDPNLKKSELIKICNLINSL